MRRAVIMLALALLFVTPAYAEGLSEQAGDILGAGGIEAGLSAESREISGGLRLDGSYDVQGALLRLWSTVKCNAAEEAEKELYICCAVIATALILNLGLQLCQSAGIKSFIKLCACASIAALLISETDSVTAEIVSAMNGFSDYSKAAMPVLFSSAALCGYAASSAAKYAAVTFAIDILMSVSQRTIIPLVYTYTALTLSNAMFENKLVSNMARFIKWLSVTMMSAMTLAFSTYIGLTGLITGSADAAAVKAARSVISSVLPVVGKIAADSSSMLLAAAGLVKNSVGVFGLIAVCAICAGPFAVLSVKLLMIKCAAAVAQMLPDDKISKLVFEISGGLSIMLGLLGCCGIMMFVSTMAAIKMVSI